VSRLDLIGKIRRVIPREVQPCQSVARRGYRPCYDPGRHNQASHQDDWRGQRRRGASSPRPVRALYDHRRWRWLFPNSWQVILPWGLGRGLKARAVHN